MLHKAALFVRKRREMIDLILAYLLSVHKTKGHESKSKEGIHALWFCRGEARLSSASLLVRYRHLRKLSGVRYKMAATQPPAGVSSSWYFTTSAESNGNASTACFLPPFLRTHRLGVLSLSVELMSLLVRRLQGEGNMRKFGTDARRTPLWPSKVLIDTGACPRNRQRCRF